MTVEFGLVLTISTLVFVAGLVMILGRRRIAENASAAGAKGMGTPRSAASIGVFFIAIALLGPVIVLVLNPRMVTLWNLPGVNVGLGLGLLVASASIGLPAIIVGILLFRRAWREREQWVANDQNRIKAPAMLLVATVTLVIGLTVIVSALIIFLASLA